MTDVEQRKQYLDQVLKEKDYVLSIIYLITNTINGKQYVGQTVSHKLHSGKYKPFGEQGRLRQHCSDAINNTKKKQCTRLNNAIRKYGRDTFTIAVLEYCLPDQSDDHEIENIKKHNTLSPHGYNLTTGGRKCNILQEQKVKLMEKSHEQYHEKKLEKFKGKKIDLTNLDQYISQCHYARFGGTYYIVKVNDVKSIFVAQHLPTEVLKEQVYDFLKKAASYAT